MNSMIRYFQFGFKGSLKHSGKVDSFTLRNGVEPGRDSKGLFDGSVIVILSVFQRIAADTAAGALFGSAPVHPASGPRTVVGSARYCLKSVRSRASISPSPFTSP